MWRNIGNSADDLEDKGVWKILKKHIKSVCSAAVIIFLNLDLIVAFMTMTFITKSKLLEGKI